MAESDRPKTKTAKQEMTVDELISNITSDQLITIVVGEKSDVSYAVFSIQIQATMLRAASPYFEKALKHAGSMGFQEEKDTLKYPEDDVKAWKQLAYYIMRREPSSDLTEKRVLHGGPSKEVLLTKCWVLGDRYLMPDFQDLVILELMEYWDHAIISVEAAKNAFQETKVDSMLRKLVTEEVVLPTSTSWKRRLQTPEFAWLDGAVGAAAQILSIMVRETDSMGMERSAQSHLLSGTHKRVRQGSDGFKSKAYEEFLLQGVPKKHWVIDGI